MIPTSCSAQLSPAFFPRASADSTMSLSVSVSVSGVSVGIGCRVAYSRIQPAGACIVCPAGVQHCCAEDHACHPAGCTITACCVATAYWCSCRASSSTVMLPRLNRANPRYLMSIRLSLVYCVTQSKKYNLYYLKGRVLENACHHKIPTAT